jgi:hypothetical protein
VEYQLVPPHYHRRKAAYRATITFKEHFVSGLASVDPDLPLHLCGSLLPHAEMTFNLLRKSRHHPQLSAAAHYHGMLDYNKNAFDPPGCNIIAHAKLAQRRTWAPHGQHLMANMVTPWSLQCTITGDKMFTSHQLPAKGYLTHWSFSLIIL